VSATFQGRNPAAQEARRILRSQIGAALEHLQGPHVTDDQIHAARKCIKRARATLRLLRETLPKKTYRLENSALRDSARPLSAARDAKVLVDALDQLMKVDAASMNGQTEHFRRALVRERNTTRRRARSGAEGLGTSRDGLQATQARAGRWSLNGQDWSVLGEGLQRVYSRGRKLLETVQRDPTAESLHEWRKLAKYLWNQVQLLEPLGSGRINELADQLHKLSDYLGDDHDLAVLRERAAAHERTFDRPEQHAALITAIEHMRSGLQQKALVLGARIYHDKPSDFAAQFARDWRDWLSTR
jgi:CHAD domain-containing protein